jgi:pyroglutamyl-peptidase
MELARRDPRLHVEVLPTEFAAAECRIGELLRSQSFDVYLALGVATSAPVVRLERTARNIDDARLADNAGEHRTGTPIVPDGPEILTSTLPLADMRAAVKESGVEAVLSDDAGGYVCNHVFYSARHVIDREALAMRCGFIHVPINAEQIPEDEKERQAMPLATLVGAIDTCLDVLWHRQA